MHTDILTMGLWTLLLLLATSVTSHAYSRMGLLLASQGCVMSLSALVDVLLTKMTGSSWCGLITATLAGGLLGLLHIPVVLLTGSAVLLIITAVSQIVLLYLWQMLPQVTGGSGGLFVPEHTSLSSAGFLFAVLTLLWVLYIHFKISNPRRCFEWACLRSLGMQASAFGVPATKLYYEGFLAYGLIIGCAGIFASRYIGYVSSLSFGIGWSLAVVMIVVSTHKWSLLSILLLCTSYAGLRTVFRHSVYASPIVSAMFEIAFPLLLLTVLLPLNPGRRLTKAH